MEKQYKDWGRLYIDTKHNGVYDAYIPIVTDADDNPKDDNADIDELNLFDLLDEDEE